VLPQRPGVFTGKRRAASSLTAGGGGAAVIGNCGGPVVDSYAWKRTFGLWGGERAADNAENGIHTGMAGRDPGSRRDEASSPCLGSDYPPSFTQEIDTMMKVLTQFSLFLAGKPGMLGAICRELGKAKINIEALTMMDVQEHGVLRLIVSDPMMAGPVLRNLNIPTSESEVLLVPMANRPGAVADVLEKLSSNHVHISYVYVTTGAPGGKTFGVFKVGDVKKAMKVIDANTKKNHNRDMKVKVRRTPSARR
jgi:hypothetical protein